MRFYKNIYKNGDTRWIKKFAFIPTRINDKVVIWMETFYKLQVMTSVFDTGQTWKDIRYELKEDYEYLMELQDR